MAISNEWTKWYLTPDGWIVGSSRLDYQQSKGNGRPEDAVLGIEYSETMQGPFSPLEKVTSEIFRGSDHKKIDALLKQYGECPGGIQSAE